MRIFSYGGGVQSTAALVLAVQRVIAYQTFIFANVGADSENPATLEYIERYAKPFAQRGGVELIELSRIKRDGSVETLVGRIFNARRSVPIPARLGNGRPGNRTCTSDFKIRVIAKWMKKNGASKSDPGTCGLGISVDELHRARTDSGIAYQVLEYPLLDLRLSRRDCEKIIKQAGLPIPPKSSCFFCPFHTQSAWLDLKRTRPDLFAKAVEIENKINAKGLHRSVLRLHSSMRPLADAVGDQMAMFPDDKTENCEEGYCMV